MTASPPLRAVELERAPDLYPLHHVEEDQVRFVHVPETAFLAMDGIEPPGSEGYFAAIGTIYRVAHELHDALARGDVHTRVGLLEALYWLTPDQDERWRWRLLVASPREASEIDVEAAIHGAEKRGPLPLVDRLHVIRWEEGPAAQILHLGPYLAETADIRRLHAAIDEAGWEPYGQHHEIYLNNPQRIGEANARTVIRRPIRWADPSDRE